jgi:cysteine-S-conjugate beta-lyase
LSEFKSLSTPLHRASTVLFDDADAFVRRAERKYDGYMYGLYATPTSEALAGCIAKREGAARAVLAPSGLAAIMLVNFAALKAGDHVLLAEAMYGPTRDAALKLLAPLGVEVGFYRDTPAFRPNTRLVWVESPGTITMEMLDVPAIAAAARERGVLTAADNTWCSSLYFKPLAHRVDFSVEALTKFAGGHSDLLLGSVAVRDEALFRRLRDVQGLLGIGASADDCFLALRGLETLEIRLERQSAAARQIAQWLAAHPAVKRVLHPALPDDPGHRLWQRDCPGAGAVFSFRLRDASWEAARRFTDALRVFRIGASWGGTRSLVAVYKDGPTLRLSIGLESAGELISDLQTALEGANP